MDALEIAKRLDLKQNVTIRVIEEATNKAKEEKKNVQGRGICISTWKTYLCAVR